MGGFANELQDRGEESKHSSAKISPRRHHDPQSSLLTYLYLMHEQHSAVASVQHHGPITGDSPSDPDPPSLCSGGTVSVQEGGVPKI